MIVRSEIEMHDGLYDLGQFWADHDQGFLVEQGQSRDMPIETNVMKAITFEMSLQRRYLYRSVETIYDLLANLGGLYGAL